MLRRPFLHLFLVLSLSLSLSPRLAAGDTYVIVHGAWGGGWAFKEVDRLLTAAGHKVYRPTLTGQGEKVHLAHPDINLTTHVTDVANVILWENLSDVVLVGHSYGGAVITGVLDRVPDRIKRAVYLDAAILNDEESFNDAFGGRPDLANVVDGFVHPRWVKPGQPLPHDVPHPAKTLTEKLDLRNQDAVARIPVAYVLYVQPGRTPAEERFHRFYLRAKERGWTLKTLASDHNAQWSHPRELAALLQEAP